MPASIPRVSPFTQAVVQAVRKLYPEKLADSSFDNTGLLLEAPYRQQHLKNSVLLTVDLTKAVADEAISRGDSVIIAYHPIIFRPLKSLTQANSQQHSLLRLAQEGISVYSPHTAVDAAGLNEWLADIVTCSNEFGHPGASKTTVHERSVITPIKDAPEGFEGTGYGKIVRFRNPQKLGDIMDRISSGLVLPGLNVAVPQSVTVGKYQIKISSIGICAGSGSMLNGLDVDLLFTGELSHHEALAAIEQGRCVITTFHSNTERLYLMTSMQNKLFPEIRKQIDASNKAGTWEQGLTLDFQIDTSRVDKDPFEMVTSPWKNW
ncbi:NGG1p interacting factor 3 [Stipitochalara longipes BDJ]|nr:NGG1p interacting factor 3 [Stipitochalara longipes BDJ]